MINGVAITRQFKALFAKDQICLNGVRPIIPEYFAPQLITLLERFTCLFTCYFVSALFFFPLFNFIRCWDKSPKKRPRAKEILEHIISHDASYDFLLPAKIPSGKGIV